jgi:acyl-CoA reductase-like NAD-dependent aldehyde dehydrogenase
VGMAPWNAPVILGVRAIAMPLACGNTWCSRPRRCAGHAFVDRPRS